MENEDNTTPDSIQHSSARYIRNHQLVVLIVGSIIIALILVAISMTLYSTSGTAQVDLSRPGLERVREQVKSVDDYKGFESTGDISEETLGEFDKLYTEQLNNVTSVDAFNPDILSDEALGVDPPAAQ